jgi:hypothetical protein
MIIFEQKQLQALALAAKFAFILFYTFIPLSSFNFGLRPAAAAVFQVQSINPAQKESLS